MQKTVRWVLNNIIPNEGIVISDKNHIPYQEVTGYFVPTMINMEYKDKSLEMGKWLSKVQNTDGSVQLGNQKYVFDTAMTCFCFRALINLGYIEFQDNLDRACAFMLSQLKDNYEFDLCYHMGDVPSKILIWCLAVLRMEGYDVEKAWQKWTSDPNLYVFDCLSHFHLYCIDAVLSIDPTNEMAKDAIKNLIKLQNIDGSLIAYRNVSWVCYTGVAQFAILCYKVGLNNNGNRAMKYLKSVMNEDGSFYGCSAGGNYFPNEKVSWTMKFYLDARLLQEKLSK